MLCIDDFDIWDPYVHSNRSISRAVSVAAIAHQGDLKPKCVLETALENVRLYLHNEL